MPTKARPTKRQTEYRTRGFLIGMAPGAAVLAIGIVLTAGMGGVLPSTIVNMSPWIVLPGLLMSIVFSRIGKITDDDSRQLAAARATGFFLVLALLVFLLWIKIDDLSRGLG